jgi:hypothetical protein
MKEGEEFEGSEIGGSWKGERWGIVDILRS